MVFWGAEVKPGVPFKPLDSDDVCCGGDRGCSRIHVSRATLGLDGQGKERTVVKCAVGGGPELLLCSFTPGVSESCSLDLLFDDDVVFSVSGSTSVHLVGYHMPQEDEDEDEEEDEEDDSDSDYEVDDMESETDSSDYDDEDEVDPSELLESGLDGFDPEEDDYDEVPPPTFVTLEAVNEHGELHIEHMQVENLPRRRRKRIAAAEDSAAVEADSEDEDGFLLPLSKKQTLTLTEIETETLVELPDAPVAQPAADPSAEANELKREKKKKNKKKKKKNLLKAEAKSPDCAGNARPKENGSHEVPLTEIAAKNGDTVTTKQKILKKASSAVRKFPNGLEVEQIAMGRPDGKQSKPGKMLSVHYTGRLKSTGKIFQSNVGKKPFKFRLGVGDVIKGWDVGLPGMRVGDKRKITVPPAMGYGATGVPGIPGNSWLIFDVEVVDTGK